MLKNINVEVVYKIIRYTPDTEIMQISVEIAAGREVDGIFVPDGRSSIKHHIRNTPDKMIQQTDICIVDAAGQVELSRMPIDNNPIDIDGAVQDHASGRAVACSEYSENDSVTVKYYYNEPGRDWFNEAAAFRQVDHPEYIGMNDYEYNSARLWAILLEMGLVKGVSI